MSAILYEGPCAAPGCKGTAYVRARGPAPRPDVSHLCDEHRLRARQHRHRSLAPYRHAEPASEKLCSICGGPRWALAQVEHAHVPKALRFACRDCRAAALNAPRVEPIADVLAHWSRRSEGVTTHAV